MLKRFGAAAGIVLAVLMIASCGAGNPGSQPGSVRTVDGPGLTRPATAEGPYAVDRVVDGDTVRVVVDGESARVRLIGIDAPETNHPRLPVQCFGYEATQHARDLVGGKDVYLEYDPSQGRQDRFGRELAYVWFDGDRMLNYEMIRDGFGHEYTYSAPYRYRDLFTQAQHEAAASDRGLWHADTCAGVVE